MRGAHARPVGRRWMAEYEAAMPGQPRRRKSAGTYDTEEQALAVAAQWRQRVLDGESTTFGPDTTVAQFAPFFLQTALLGRRTRADYASALELFVLPTFGGASFKALNSVAYKRWRSALIDRGVPDTSVRKAKSVLSALVTAAVEEGCLPHNAVRILKVRRARRRTIRIMTVEQFDLLLRSLDSEARRLYLEVAIESGMRPGELMALSPQQCDRRTCVITVNRAVAVPGKRWSLSGDRFDLNDYPKDHEDREVQIAPDLMDRLWALIERHELGPDHVIFNPTVMGFRRPPGQESGRTLGGSLPSQPEGWTEPNARGKQYRHGTNTGYTLGGCREDCCRIPHNEAARARRAATPRERRAPQVDFMAPESWRAVFYRALKTADVGLRPGEVQPRHMRHTHVSWRLGRGENAIDVMTDVGHSDLSVTRLYRVQTDAAPRLRLVR